MMGRTGSRPYGGLFLAVLWVAGASAVLPWGVFTPHAFAQQYVRPVDVAPQPDDIGEDYVLPEVQRPLARAHWLHVLDLVLLATTLGFVTWVVHRRRSRNLLVGVTIFSLAYFGFYREGCICPVGSTQNIVVALTDSSYSIPPLVVWTFFLPLILALLVGRVFCGGVCPLGAIQDLVVLRPVQVPSWLEKPLGWFKYVYLGLGIAFALLPEADRDFVICRFDPFVGFFRRHGPGYMLILGGGILVAGMFVGRLYCRFLCPYGALLAMISSISWKKVSITPDRELDCGLCARACPFGAIEKMRAQKSSCLACARCYASCPPERIRRGELIDITSLPVQS